MHLQNPIYNGVLTSTTLVYTIALELLEANLTWPLLNENFWIEFPAILLSVIFLLDLIANIALLGIRRICKDRKILILEIFISLAFWVTYVLE